MSMTVNANMAFSRIRLVGTQSIIAVVMSISPTIVVPIAMRATLVITILLCEKILKVHAQKMSEMSMDVIPGIPGYPEITREEVEGLLNNTMDLRLQ